MRRAKIGNTYYLILGLVFFPLGLLMLLRVSPIIDLMNSITSESQIVEVFGLILQFLGEGLICFSIIGAISGKVIANTEYNRQVLVASNVRNTQEQTALISGFQKSIDEQMTQLNFKLNQLQNQKSATVFAQSPAKCRFCGAKMDPGGFCPSCGKAN